MPTNDLYMVVDLEATCSDEGAVPRAEMEIIEIGAVMVDGESLSPIDEWQSFIRPQRHPQLTDFCRSLTSINQAQVDAAALFPDVLADFIAWIAEFTARGFAEPVFGSWGDYDRLQFAQDCELHGIAYPLPPTHLNIKRRFQEELSLKRKVGLKGALKHVGLPLDGTHHRGIDDARNIAKLLPYALGRVE